MRATFLLTLLALGCGSPTRERTPARPDSAPAPAPDSGAPGTLADGAAATGPVECAADAADAIPYLALDKHPGCTIADSVDATTGKLVRALEYTPASIPGYRCAAKELRPAVEDVKKPIVLLIHGNSDRPVSWERCDPGTNGGACLQTDEMLAEKLVALGHRVYAVDMRYERVCASVKDGYSEDCKTDNPGRNMSHRWGVPIVQHLIRSVLDAFPGRRVSLVGHSFGVTAIRDALRRLQCVEKVNPWPRLDALVFAAGGNHGVSTFDGGYCTKYAQSMRGQVTCEMGSRQAYTPTAFGKALSGASGQYETPCSATTRSAFGWQAACGGNTVRYRTIVMQDKADGTYKDEFVSEASAALKGATNVVLTLTDYDTSGYFFPQKDAPFNGLGLFHNHFGGHRSIAAVSSMLASFK